jgi:hypothetical protein
LDKCFKSQVKPPKGKKKKEEGPVRRIQLLYLFLFINKMLLYKRSIVQLPKATAMLRVNGFIKPFIGVRYNSSSSVNNKLELDTATSTTSTTSTSDSKKASSSSVKLQEQEEKKLSFMPVINIPETEFAHHTFFSLDRPLLGLSDEEEKPFFSNKTEISEEEKRKCIHVSSMRFELIMT